MPLMKAIFQRIYALRNDDQHLAFAEKFVERIANTRTSAISINEVYTPTESNTR